MSTDLSDEGCDVPCEETVLASELLAMLADVGLDDEQASTRRGRDIKGCVVSSTERWWGGLPEGIRRGVSVLMQAKGMLSAAAARALSAVVGNAQDIR
jgi:hypothetical protein